MRLRCSLLLPPVVLTLLAPAPSVARETLHDQGVDAPLDGEREARAGSVELGARGLAAVGSDAAFAVGGVSLGYRLFPSLELGAYGELASLSEELGERRCAEAGKCSGNFQRFGLRGALHLLPEFVIDPWLGAALGGVHLSSPHAGDALRGDVTLEVGVDVQPTTWLALGPYVTVARAMESRTDYDGFSGVGLRLTVALEPGVAARHMAARF
ncbi:MAG: hypothetical protein KF718_30545 [Polyangiaceae bacterium]|nr:hypothetical protein [Polyangiaceae bacterium]